MKMSREKNGSRGTVKAVIYLLAAEKGRFLPDDCLSRNGVGLPNEWVHGYTKGLVLYKYYVIYWLEVW